ncbi:MAG: response regulator [Verrucomicrobiota bacterium]
MGELAGALLECQNNPPHRILMVDDDFDIRRLSADVLTRSGYAVDSAEDGAVAWETLQRNNYDLLITDHNMPKVSGIELVKKVHAARMALPVILMSGSILTDELNRHPALQIEAALLKPYTVAQLLGTVKNVLLATAGERVPPALPSIRPGQASVVRLRL